MKRFSISRRGFLASALTGCSAPALGELVKPKPTTKDVPWLAEVQTPPEQVPAVAANTKIPTHRLSPLLVDENGNKITTLAGWLRKRERIRRWWVEFLKPFTVDRSGPPPLEVIAEDRPEGVVRQLVRYEVEPGLPVEGYLLKPAKIEGRRPAVVALHSTVNHTIRQPAGVEGRPEKAFGLKFARRGYVTFCPRNYLWPETKQTRAQRLRTDQVKLFETRHPGSKGMAKMLFDAMTAVDILAAMPEVDSGRLGAVGHSLGAKEVLYLAAFDERIKVTVSSEGGIGTTFCNWYAPWYLGEEVRSSEFVHEHHEVLALVAPRAFLLLGGDKADGAHSWPLIEAVLPVYKLYGEPPRVGLFNHKQGHAVPPEAEKRIYEWFGTYL